MKHNSFLPKRSLQISRAQNGKYQKLFWFKVIGLNKLILWTFSPYFRGLKNGINIIKIKYKKDGK